MLEERRVMATFLQFGSDLNLDLTAANTKLAVTAGASSYTLTLTGGDTWTSSNIAGATGSGSTSLIVTKNAFTTINVADSNTGAAVDFNNSFSSTYTDNLSVVLDAATAGTITFVGTTSMTDSNSLSVSTARNILVSTSATVSAVNGNLTLQANQQVPATSGNFVGVDVSQDGLIQSTGTGLVTVLGRGGDHAGGSQHGVRALFGGDIIGNVGLLTVRGTGGSISGTGIENHGVYVRVGSTITSSNGPVLVEGTGGGAVASGSNVGVALFGGTITNTGTGAGATLTVRGTGGTGTGFDNMGVYLIQTTLSFITSSGGDVLVEGTGGGSGAGGGNHGVAAIRSGPINSTGTGATVTVRGNGGNTSGMGTSNNYGVYVAGSTVTSSGGAVLVEGTGGGSGASGSNYGVAVIDYVTSGIITSAGTGATVTVRGNGGNTSGTGPNNVGVFLQAFAPTYATITSSGGAVLVEGTGASNSFGINLAFSGAAITSGSNAAITLVADSMNLGSTINAGMGGPVTLRQRTNGTLINLGGSDVRSGSPLALGLDDAELDRITAGTINIGDTNSGAISISSPITRPATTNLNLATAATTGVSPIAVTDLSLLSTGTLAFASGTDLKINIAGLTVNTQYNQLNVIGAVDLTGVDLALTGAFVSGPGNVFTIVSATSVSNTFNGLANNAVVPFNGRLLRVNYTATTVTLTDVGLANQPPTIASNAAAVSGNEGGTVTNAGTFSDAQGNATVTITASIGTVTQNNAAGTWSWSLNAADGPAGPFTVTITATDNQAAAANTTFTYAVNNVPPPISLSGNATVDEGSPYMLNLGAISDPGTDTVTAYSINWGDGPAENFTGNPANTIATHFYADGPNGYTITVTLTDEDGTVTGGSLSVVVLNVAPTAVDDAIALLENDSAQVVNVLANDSDPAGANDPLSITSVNTTGTFGAVTLNAGQVSYSPDGFFEALGAGETTLDTFEYSISDGDGGTDTAIVTVTITGQNDAPTATGTLPNVSVNQNAANSVISLTGLFADVDANDTLSITAVSSSNGLVTAGVSGSSLTLDYQANQSGTATITVTATDGSGASVSLTFNVAVVSPAQQVNATILLIQQWKADVKINAGEANSMIVKLENSLKSYDNGNITAAGNRLNALKNEISAKVKPGSPLTLADATLAISLIDALYDSMTP